MLDVFDLNTAARSRHDASDRIAEPARRSDHKPHFRAGGRVEASPRPVEAVLNCGGCPLADSLDRARALVYARPATPLGVAERNPRGLTLMKISARNVLSGKVIALTKGATTAHVKIEIAAGAVVTASITNEAVDALGLAVGKKASAVIKASDVMVAID